MGKGIIIHTPIKFAGRNIFDVEIPDGYNEVADGLTKAGDQIWHTFSGFRIIIDKEIGKNVLDYFCVIRKIKTYRYIIDRRNSIMAVCDTHHPSYAARTSCLYEDDKYIVAVETGTFYDVPFRRGWELEQYQIDRMNKLCYVLNNPLDPI